MEQKEKQGGGLSSGFLLGVVVGVIITLLLTTKRGKRILKLITEEGMSKLSNWEDLFHDAVEEYQTKPAEPKLPPVDLSSAEDQEDEDTVEAAPLEEESEPKHVEKKEQPKTIKRFFKGIPRHTMN